MPSDTLLLLQECHVLFEWPLREDYYYYASAALPVFTVERGSASVFSKSLVLSGE